MKRNLYTSRRPSLSGIGIFILVSSLLAGPGAAGIAFAVDPASPATQPPAPTSAPAVTTEPSVAPESSTDPDAAPSATARGQEAMAEAVGVGGAEMGQRSARVTGSAASAGAGKMTTESLATEGTWSPTFGVQGLDVSGHQPTVDWQQQWNMGSRFAYVKATEGNYYTNPSYSSQYQGSRSVGMIRGAYHFAIPNWSSGADQARFFAQNGGGWSSDGYTMPPVLDFEFNPYEGRTINGFDFGNTCYGMTPAQLQSWVHDFGNTMLAMTGRLPVIYTNTSWWNYCLGNPAGFGEYPLWIAAYPNSPTNNAGPVPTGSWSDYSIWQYSSTGPFAGDSNVWNGDYTSLQTFAKGSPPPVPTDPTRKVFSPGDFNGDGISDLIQRRADGELWLLAGDGTGRFYSSQRIGTGWQIYDRVLGVGDYNGDGRNDIVARKMDGSLWFYAGTGQVSAASEGYRGGVRIGEFGWNDFDLILGVRDFDGNGKADLIARTPNGNLFLYSGNGTGATGTGRYLDFGWEVFDQLVSVQDFDGDGTSDIIGKRPDGALWFYSNSGRSTFVNPRQIGTGWNIYTGIIGTGDGNGDRMSDLVGVDASGGAYFYAGTAMRDQGYEASQKIGEFGWDGFDAIVGSPDFNGDGRADLLARRPEGTLWFYPGTTSGTYGAARKIGAFGWEAFDSLTAVGDLSGDGKNDLLARRPDGTLWLYRGTGRVDASSTGYSPAIRIGNYGWEVFDSLIGTGDLDGNGKTDFLARGRDGSLWLYRGTGAADSTSSGYLPGVKVGAFGWGAFDQLFGSGDFNADGKNDIIGRTPDGALWFYPGNGTGTPAASRRIGTGWNIFDRVLNAWNFNADAQPDLVSRRPDGSLWSYAGTGMKPNEGYLGRVWAAQLQ